MKRNCECCKAEYITGKQYGEYWCELPILRRTSLWEKVKFLLRLKWKKFVILEPKGLCEFCNPNNKWFIKDKKCHKTK